MWAECPQLARWARLLDLWLAASEAGRACERRSAERGKRKAFFISGEQA